MISKIVLKSDVWPGSEKCGFNPKFEDNDLKSGCYRVPKLPPLSVNYVCPISQETNHPIMIPKIVLKSVLWRGSESALNCCIFQLLCFSLHPNVQGFNICNIFLNSDKWILMRCSLAVGNWINCLCSNEISTNLSLGLSTRVFKTTFEIQNTERY